jgi:Tfp pilus assembly protein PilV
LKRFTHACAGSSLFEVLIALSLAAMIALGALSSQTQALRLMRVALEYRRAAWIADAAAETLRSGLPRDAVRREWDRRARATLPNGRFDLDAHTGDIDLLEVSWFVDRISGEMSCRSGSACIRIAVVRQARPEGVEEVGRAE